MVEASAIVPVKRGPGRPKGSKNSTAAHSQCNGAKRGPGRPKGSGRRGWPKDSKNKPRGSIEVHDGRILPVIEKLIQQEVGRRVAAITTMINETLGK